MYFYQFRTTYFHFTFMLSNIHYPENLSPEQLDDYLAKGWFRMGQMIFTSHFLHLEGTLYSPIWLRLSMANYAFRKRLRKIMRRVESRFRIEVKVAEVNESKEQLYQHHKNRFSGFICETLAESLLEFSSKNIYPTYEIEVYDGEKLIAVSFFDKGNNSLAAILALFHPKYEKYSLGIYTMLAEIKYGQQLGLAYYYPGYVIHDNPKFDYKLRLGAMDYFSYQTQSWKPYKDLEENKLPGVLLKNRLKLMQEMLSDFEINNQILMYLPYDKSGEHNSQHVFMKNPLFIACNFHYLSAQITAIEYDLQMEKYRLSRFSRLDSLFSFFSFLTDEKHDLDNTYFDYLVRDYVIVESELPEVILYALKSQIRKAESSKN